MQPPNDLPYLKHIQDAIQDIEHFLKGIDQTQFSADKKSHQAVIRSLEIIGEAASKISTHLKQKSPHIPWEDIINMRHRLIHGYFQVNLETVWQVVTKDLPELKQHLVPLLDSLDTQK